MGKLSTFAWFGCLISVGLGCATTETAPPAAAAPPATATAAQGSEVPPATPAAVAAPAMDFGKRYVECWGYLNDKKWDQFSGCYAENATSQWLDTGMPMVTSRTDIIEKQTKPFVAAFPDLRGDVQLVLVNGHTGLSLAIMHGTHEGTLQSPMGAIPATHKKFGMLVGHMIEFNDKGEVTKETFVQDMGTMMAQLGLSPAPARAAIEGAGQPTEINVATGSAAETANLAASDKLNNLFSAHDKAMADSVSDNVTDHNPSFPADLVGKQAMMGLMDSFWKGFPDLKANVTGHWAAGDYVVSQFTFGGTNQGPVPQFGITKPTGKPFSVTVLEVTKWKDGKCTDIWPMFNGAAVANQLGLVPPPSAAGKDAAGAKKADKAKPAAKPAK